MRPKLIALLAVSAFAIVGCGGTEQAQTTNTEMAKVSPSPVESAAPKSKSTSSAIAKSSAPTEFTEVEKQFLSFVESRATVHTTKIGVSDRTVIESFDGYCDKGKQMDVSDNEELNENLEVIAESTFCDMRD